MNVLLSSQEDGNLKISVCALNFSLWPPRPSIFPASACLCAADPLSCSLPLCSSRSRSCARARWVIAETCGLSAPSLPAATFTNPTLRTHTHTHTVTSRTPQIVYLSPAQRGWKSEHGAETKTTPRTQSSCYVQVQQGGWRKMSESVSDICVRESGNHSARSDAPRWLQRWWEVETEIWWNVQINIFHWRRQLAGHMSLRWFFDVWAAAPWGRQLQVITCLH